MQGQRQSDQMDPSFYRAKLVTLAIRETRSALTLLLMPLMDRNGGGKVRLSPEAFSTAMSA